MEIFFREIYNLTTKKEVWTTGICYDRNRWYERQICLLEHLNFKRQIRSSTRLFFFHESRQLCPTEMSVWAINWNNERQHRKFIFHALHEYDRDWKPKILLADAGEAITAGFSEVFGAPQVRIMCFFHVLKNLEKILKVLKDNKTGSRLRMTWLYYKLVQMKIPSSKQRNYFC